MKDQTNRHGRMFWRHWLQRLGVVACGAAILLGGGIGYYAGALPDHYYVETGGALQLQTALPVTAVQTPSAAATREATLRLFGLFPVKTVSLTPMRRASVYIGGEPFGIRMLMAGAMVVSLSDVTGREGTCCPAAEAGIAVGDVIQAVNGVTVHSNADVQEQIAMGAGEPLQVTLLRNDLPRTVTVQPVYSVLHGCWQTGMWVRDSTAGIGTVTYYCETAGEVYSFGGLGHAVCDTDTGEQIPLAAGEVVGVQVTDVLRSKAGSPGALQGRMVAADEWGTLFSNTERGVFGYLEHLPAGKTAVPIAFRQEVARGPAEIFTTLSGDAPSRYTIEIEELHSADTGTRNMVIHITDARLLEETGGIVQGMSGSPILQNGRLVGAVTHVFVSDPTRGYGIFAENMYAHTLAGQLPEE
ncbi:MAG: SpoIVB peptidase [Oscillospiraceae bacterium]|nr:SpoIVB peptidase [Oscillospiraceae bacterium]